MRLLLQSAVVVAVLILFLFAEPSAYAAACVSNATGNWSAPGTWTGCNAGIPTAADTVEIRDGRTVTVDVTNAVAASIQIGGSSATAGTLVFNSGSQVTVSGILTVGGSTVTADGTLTMTNGGTATVRGLAIGSGNNNKTWTPGTGTIQLTATNTLPAARLSFNNLTVTAGTTTLADDVDVDGTLTQTSGNVAVGSRTLTVNGTHNAGTNTVSGAGIYVLAIGATLLSGHTAGVAGNITTTTKTLSTAANYTFNGSSAQVTSTTMPATVRNLTINNAAGVTLSRTTATSGTLIVTAGTFTVGAFTYSVTGNTTVSGTLSVTSTTGTKTFTGNVTINNGGSWNETANEAISFGGSLQNDGTLTAGTGVHTFTGTAKTISGVNAIAIPSLIISGTTTNNGTLTVATTLGGASTLANGTNATLNFGGSSITPTLTATATGNTVNYNLAGAQTIKGTTYYNLTLSGSGLKTTSSVTVNGTLSMQGTATASAAPTYGATATLEYKGSAAQIEGPELLATMAAGRTVVINNAAGVTLAGDTAVNGNLTFTIGNVATGANTLYIGSGGTVSRTSGHVVGNFKKFITTGATGKTFEVGDAGNYTPVLVSFASVTTAGDLTTSVISGDHPSIGTSTVNASQSVNRNWTLANGGIVFTTYDATFNFVAPDVDGGASTNAFNLARYNSGSWTYPGVGTKTTTSTQATALSGFGDFQIGTTTYGISGHIQNASGLAISGVTVNLSGGQTSSTTTDVGGNYSFAGLPATNNYTVTPTKTDYTFSEASLTYNNLAANQTTSDFTGSSTVTYSISGHIQNASSLPISGVTVTLSGAQTGTTTTDASGNFSFPALPSTNNYTVTPSLINYTFSAASRTYNALEANQTTPVFTGTSTVNYSISGHIQNASSIAIGGVTVTLSGGQSGSTSTDVNGDYSFASLPSTNNYTVTPSLTGYAFSAASQTYNALAANQTNADFSGASTLTHTISGHIQNASSVAISGVTVTLSGGQTGTTTTNASGDYSFANLPSTNDYTVTPSKPNYTFIAASLNYNNLSSNQTAADFTGALVPYYISGHIADGSSTAVSGVTVTLSGGQAGTTTTDASGYYFFAGLLSDESYTVTPSKTNYAFNPVNLTYNNMTANVLNADFTGTDFSGHAPSLAGATSFAVLAATTVTNTGLTVVSGNIGVSPGTAVTGFGPGVIQNGAIYSGSGSLAGPAQASALTAYNDLKGQGCLPSNNLSGKILGVTTGAVTLGPGVYCFDTSAQLTTTLTLDDGGDPNALFIFQIGTTLTTASNAQVVMSSGGRGDNVYWAIGTSATLGTFTAFRGNVIADTSITVTTGVNTNGRLFALGGAVTMDTNNVNAVLVPAPPDVTLTVSVNPTGTVQPRTDLVYTISFSNDGTGSASAFVITDPIPANTDFKLGSMTTSLGTTGLTPTLAYSDDGGLTWAYTPLSAGGGAPAGYDRDVTHVRWSFGSSLSPTSPNNAGSVTLTARIR